MTQPDVFLRRLRVFRGLLRCGARLHCGAADGAVLAGHLPADAGIPDAVQSQLLDPVASVALRGLRPPVPGLLMVIVNRMASVYISRAIRLPISRGWRRSGLPVH